MRVTNRSAEAPPVGSSSMGESRWRQVSSKPQIVGPNSKQLYDLLAETDAGLSFDTTPGSLSCRRNRRHL